MKTLNKTVGLLVLFGLVLDAMPSFAQVSTYRLIDLGTMLEPHSYGLAINEQGQVAGYGRGATASRAFVFSDGAITELGVEGGANSYATSINFRGQVAGFFEGTNGPRAFLYRQGEMFVFGGMADTDHFALGLNNAGWVVGHARATSGSRAFLHDGNEARELAGLGGSNTVAYSINSAGVVAGSSLTKLGATTHAVLWENDRILDLNAPSILNAGWELEEARAINEAGHITGIGLRNQTRQAFLMRKGRVTGAGLLANGTFSAGYGLNGSNQVVGVAGLRGMAGTRAILWDSETLVDLNSKLRSDSGWELREARGINDRGQIVGWGTIRGEDHAFLLLPAITEQSSGIQKLRQAVPAAAPQANGGMFFTVASAGSASVTNNPLADAHVRDGASNNVNFGLATVLELQTGPNPGTNKDVYLKFSIDNAPIPLGSAKLRIFASYSNNGSVTSTLYSVTDTNWTEAGIKWTNRPALGSARTNQVFNVKAGATYDIDVTGYVRAEQTAGRGIITLAFHNPTNTTLLTSISSLQNSTVANRPRLLLLTNTPPVVSINSPAGGASFPAPTNLVISVTASDPDGSVTNLDLYAGGLLIGRNATNAFSFTWTNAPVGTFALTARATDNLGCTVTSTVVAVTVATARKPLGDAHVLSSSPALNFGSSTNLEVQTNSTSGPTRDAYLKFSLAGLANISSAKLRLNAAASSSATVSGTIYSVADTNWQENSITYNSRPPLGAVLGHLQVTTTAWTWFTNDVTALIRAEKAAGRDIVTLAVHSLTNNSKWIKVNSLNSTSNRPELVITVTNTPPSVTLNAPISGSVFGEPAAIAMTAIASDPGGGIAQVEFFAGTVSLGARSVPPYTITWSNVAAGAYSLTARAMDNEGLSATSSVVNVTVDLPPGVTLTSPAAGALIVPPAPVFFLASASNNNGPVTRVDFFANGAKVGEAMQPPFEYSWTNAPAGTSSVWAVAYEANGLSAASASRVVVVDGRIPAAWLTQYFGAGYAANPNALPDADPDGDGVNNIVEYLQGRDPTVGATADTGGVIGLRVFTPLR